MCKMVALKPEEKRLFERHESRWEDNIKISLKIIII